MTFSVESTGYKNKKGTHFWIPNNEGKEFNKGRLFTLEHFCSVLIIA